MFKKPIRKEIARLLVETLQPEIDRCDIASYRPVFGEERGSNSRAGAGIISTGACHYGYDLMIAQRSPRRRDRA